MTQDDKTICPHCGQKMSKWSSPAVQSWGSEFQYICFNDDCGYYKRGWEHTFKTIGINASYRHRYDPNTGQLGPFPVSSPKAGKEGIIAED
jgi:hypothetical protein